MNISGQDRAVIEQALREAINVGGDYHKIINYREVLTKLQGIPLYDRNEENEQVASLEDGFRYDYDDSSSPD